VEHGVSQGVLRVVGFGVTGGVEIGIGVLKLEGIDIIEGGDNTVFVEVEPGVGKKLVGRGDKMSDEGVGEVVIGDVTEQSEIQKVGEVGRILPVSGLWTDDGAFLDWDMEDSDDDDDISLELWLVLWLNVPELRDSEDGVSPIKFTCEPLWLGNGLVFQMAEREANRLFPELLLDEIEEMDVRGSEESDRFLVCEREVCDRIEEGGCRAYHETIFCSSNRISTQPIISE